MPQLPSGRHFAIQADSLTDMLENAARGIRTHELMVINDTAQLYAYLDVLYFRSGTARKIPPQYFDEAHTPPEKRVPYASGHTLATLIEQEIRHWTAADQNALFDFLLEFRTRQYLLDWLNAVEKVKDRIRQHGHWLARLQALWWDTGCHPLQPEQTINHEDVTDMDNGK
ncbi:MAG: hypothetical protein WD572_10510 [Gammaproteobacteria bacterium]